MVGVHTNSVSAPTEFATLSERVDLADKARKLGPDTRKHLATITGGVLDMRTGEGATRSKHDVAFGLVQLAAANPPGSVLRDQVVRIALLILVAPSGSTLADLLAGLNEVEAAAFRQICAIVSEVRTR